MAFKMFDGFKKVKETEYYILYLEEKPKINGQQEIIVKYKLNNKLMRCLLTDDLYKLFFEPSEYKKARKISRENTK